MIPSRKKETTLATRVVVGVLFLVAIFLIADTAFAHTEAEIQEWEEQWEASMAEAQEKGEIWESVVRDLLRGRTYFMDRHPCYFYGDCPTPETHAPVSASTPSAPRPSVEWDVGAGVEQWRGLVASYFPAGEVERALCIMWFESRGDPNAKNPSSGAAGLFQVMPFWWDHYGGDRYDPTTNVSVASLILASQGWTAWSPYKRGECH